MTQRDRQRIAIHQLLHILGEYQTADNSYYLKFAQIYGAVRVLNWLGLASNPRVTEIWNTALNLSAEESRGHI